MTYAEWKSEVLAEPGAIERVAAMKAELRLAVALTALREQAGLSQRQLAKRLGVSQPRVAAIESAQNVTLDVLDRYVRAVGGKLEASVVKGGQRFPIIGAGSNVTTPEGTTG